jgi:glycosyltransferase involved in cell wall biosynthesis
MRILAFSLNAYEYGRLMRGAERRFLEISTHLKNLGAEIFAIEYECSKSEKSGTHGYFPIRIKRLFSNHNLLSALEAILLGWVACIEHKCDIIYVTCTISWSEGPWVGLIAPYVVSCLSRKPLVIIFHHLQPSDSKERNPLILRAYRKATCMAVSQATADDVKNYFDVQDVKVVGNGINSNLFRINDRRKIDNDAVFLGRVAEDKGIFILVKAWKKVVDQMPSAHLLLVGGVDSRIRERLHKTIRELGLQQTVTIAGFVPERRMARLLQSSKIFVLPSLREGFGLAVAEAMAAGLPCIISDLPALREFYSSAAIFVPPSNVESLSDAVLFLLQHPEKRRELRKRGQKIANRFSWKEVALKEFGIFERVIARGDLQPTAATLEPRTPELSSPAVRFAGATHFSL